MAGTNGNNSGRTAVGTQKLDSPVQAEAIQSGSDCSLQRELDLKCAKIAMIQRAIAAGTYHVPPGAVAGKVVERLVRTPRKTEPAEVPPMEGRHGDA